VHCFTEQSKLYCTLTVSKQTVYVDKIWPEKLHDQGQRVELEHGQLASRPRPWPQWLHLWCNLLQNTDV